ncbi:LysR family transcriptional regulator [Bordetella sp. FB-8]|uniref:LysR family transcriptional regulator n=1 Tax=Bordetella sp. FB-8 TaxID=1159870 RepID=UPI0003A209CE|nr:LysR family transcriptional regulator [Bordetella sp. FB-8]
MDMNDLTAFVAVARASGFRDAARAGGVSASSLSTAVQRLEGRLGMRLLNRTTRSVTPTEAGRRLLERLAPLFGEIEAALDVLNGFRDKPIGTLRLNVPAHATQTILPSILSRFIKAYPGIHIEVLAEDSFVNLLEIGCDAGIRYDERLEQDMIAVPIGPRIQRFAVAASPDYLAAHGRPEHPQDLLTHACLRGQFSGGAKPLWHFECDGEIIHLDPPPGPLLVRPGLAITMLVRAALDSVGIVNLWEDMLRPHLDSGQLVPLLEPWWQSFPGPFLYYPGRRHLPAPLRAFVDFIKG